MKPLIFANFKYKNAIFDLHVDIKMNGVVGNKYCFDSFVINVEISGHFKYFRYAWDRI